MIRILNIEPAGYSREAKSILDRIGEVDELELPQEELATRIGPYHVLIVRLRTQIGQQVLTNAKNLKVIVTATTGLDHIDLHFARSRDITVLSLQGEVTFLETVHATAEHTMALMLALMRNIPAAFASVRSGAWNRDEFKGNELAAKRLGLVGLGRVARRVARYANAFGMSVHAFDPFTSSWMSNVTRHETLEGLLAVSDVLSMHVPLNNETQGMLDAACLQRLPQGSWLINTSRGELIDEQALANALLSRHIAGAALDVLGSERSNLINSPLLSYAKQHGNLLITPHIAGATFESMEKTEIFMANKLAAHFGLAKPGTQHLSHG